MSYSFIQCCCFAAMFISLATPALAADANKVPADKGLKAGAAVVDITPEKWPLFLRGSFTPRPADAAIDPLHVRALALQNGDGRVVIAIVDNLMIDRDTLDAIKARAAEATGWKTSQMLIAATHTHSAPSISDKGSPPAAAYNQKATDGIFRAITTAIAALQPASAGWGSDSVPDEVFNRRWYLKDGTMPPNPFGEIDLVKMNPSHASIVKPAGPTDPEVCALDIRTRKGQPLCILANYSLHYVGGMTPGKVSADYFGEFARLMPWRVGAGRNPETFVAMLSNGACGDINNIDFAGTRAPREPFEQIRLVAAKVADASWRAIRKAERHADVPVAIVQREVELTFRKPTAEQVERARKVVAMPEEEAKKLPNLAANYARGTIGAAERSQKTAVLLQALRIGDQAIVTMPFEVFVEIGLELKKKSPFPRTFIIELANGAGGYLPTPQQHELGGYETWLGTNKVQKDASEILTRNLLEMLKELNGK